MNLLLMPPTNVAHQTRIVNGRTYAAAPGSTITAPDFDAATLEANGWTRVALTGTTAQRPAGTMGPYPAVRGQRFYDTTISAMIEFDGQTWRNVSGTAV